jgi:hypothetical protein
MESYPRSGGVMVADEMSHVWSEFYLPTIGWVTADPSFEYYAEVDGQTTKLVDWSSFAAAEPDRVHIFFSYSSGEENVECTYLGSGLSVSTASTLELGNGISGFRDLHGHWAESDVIQLLRMRPGLFGGTSPGCFSPNKAITRAELAALLCRLSTEAPAGEPISFRDVPAGKWYAADVARASAYGYMVGDADGCFHPEAELTRAELVVALMRFFSIPRLSGPYPFIDLDQPGFAWAKGDIIAFYRAGLANGTTESTFSPEKAVTRAEMAVFLYRILGSAYGK